MLLIFISAQKLGIFPLAPDQKQLLTEEEWKDLKVVSIKRDSFVNPCAICKDCFRLEDQVLLSCSHVFHRVSFFLYFLVLVYFTIPTIFMGVDA